MAKRVTESIISSTFLPLIAKVLGDGRRAIRGAQPHQRRTVRGRDDDHGALEASRPEVVLEERAHFAAAFADQREHDDVGLGAARHHAEQRALADAAAAEQADALAAAAGQHGVDGAHAGANRSRDWLARQRIE